MSKVETEMERVPTGNAELDALIEGGFPKDGLILIAGYPGSGKSTLAAQYIYDGATKYGEKGVYVCFSETKRSLQKIWKRFGWDFEKLEFEGKVSILDLTTIKESGLQNSINTVFEKVNLLKANRLVIDSFTAMALTLREPSDIRFLLHLIYKFVQEIKCTTIIIADTQWGTQKIGSGMEEFIADGIMLMQSYFNENGELKRRLRILKLRGTRHTQETHYYEISDSGIRIL
jgi:circadian clock protein KaiC